MQANLKKSGIHACALHDESSPRAIITCHAVASRRHQLVQFKKCLVIEWAKKFSLRLSHASCEELFIYCRPTSAFPCLKFAIIAFPLPCFESLDFARYK